MQKHKLPDDMFEVRKASAGGLEIFKDVLPGLAKDLYKVPAVKKLYEKRKEYDLIITDHLFNEIAYPFVHEVPFITVATPGMDHRQSAAFGNVLNPSYAPTLLGSYMSSPMSLWHRLMNTCIHLWIPFVWRIWFVVPLVQKEISAQFPDLPPLLELERNQSLTLMNTHFSITSPLPLLPSQVEVGAMHCRPAKPLPKTATAGPLEVLRESWRACPDNVRIKQLAPTAGRPRSRQREGVHLPRRPPQPSRVHLHATPLLVLPIFFDQPRNAMFVENSGLGRMLVWEELTADSIVDAFTDIITKPKLVSLSSPVQRERGEDVGVLKGSADDAAGARSVLDRVRDPPPRGPQLRCPAAQLSWVQFLMLDVVGFLLAALLLLVFILRRLVRAAYVIIFGGRAKKKKE
ncbi:UDP-glucuronosyltransferase 2B28 [Chionoecetes opilio]|uniref:UDP-glucuronosyltransferase 2B28 n=1 Tax=Chionoecetes opilio TaxID=41210 RepID=A0A8J4XKT3_CHIOP|nr:UDP-glucuronosyltransferase 2B28 [Chionoecetes opilio]